MREIDLKKYEIRTDLVEDQLANTSDIEGLKRSCYTKDDIRVSNIIIEDKASQMINKESGIYTTIYFDDITDSTNYSKVLKIFINELKKVLDYAKVSTLDNILIIGLGNDKSTPDSIGPKTIDNILVTRHIYLLTNTLEDGYKITSKIAPGVMSNTGIETSDIIASLVNNLKCSYVIVIDALSSDAIGRVTRCIQITNTGIKPGSGIGNKRKEISYNTLHIPTIAIGVPMVVEASTIVSDTLEFIQKHFSYNIKNKDNPSLKLIPNNMKNYLKVKDNLSLNNDEKQYLLGALGLLDEYDKKALIDDVLTPIGFNLMVTPKEVDFLIERLSTLIGNGINKTIHNIKTE